MYLGLDELNSRERFWLTVKTGLIYSRGKTKLTFLPATETIFTVIVLFPVLCLPIIASSFRVRCGGELASAEFGRLSFKHYTLESNRRGIIQMTVKMMFVAASLDARLWAVKKVRLKKMWLGQVSCLASPTRDFNGGSPLVPLTIHTGWRIHRIQKNTRWVLAFIWLHMFVGFFRHCQVSLCHTAARRGRSDILLSRA